MKKHVVMRFSFAGCHAAYKFRDLLQTLDLPAAPEFRLGLGWTVKTDTRVLAYAESVTRFLSRAKEAA
jgi:hypothetical protein